MTLIVAAEDVPARDASPLGRAATAIRRNPTIVIGVVMLVSLIAMTLAAPWIAGDPFRQAPINRLRPPSERFWFGTDQFGRDVFARTVHGARVSLIVGLAVAGVASLVGARWWAGVRLFPPHRQRHHAGDGRYHGNPLNPARHCPHHADAARTSAS